MTVDCDMQRNILTVVWIAIGFAIAGPIGYLLGTRRRSSKREYTYKGSGGEG